LPWLPAELTVKIRVLVRVHAALKNTFDRSKNRAAIHNAPIRSPAAQAKRIWSVLQVTTLAKHSEHANGLRSSEALMRRSMANSRNGLPDRASFLMSGTVLVQVSCGNLAAAGGRLDLATQ